jgi:hypothetical protein
MEELLSFLRTFETFIYLFLGACGLIYLRKFILAWQELRGAAFGLERDGAQSRLNQAASALVLLLTAAVVVFIMVSFVAPAMPGVILPTPTLNLLATATTTLPAGAAPQAGTPAPGAAQPPEPVGEGCIPGQVEIAIPKSGEEVSGISPVVGTANIANFGFYKFEIKRPNETTWLTIQAGNTPKTNDKLGDWDTSRLAPGEYQLGLVVVDNQAQALPPCVVQLRVARAPELTPAP